MILPRAHTCSLESLSAATLVLEVEAQSDGRPTLGEVSRLTVVEPAQKPTGALRQGTQLGVVRWRATDRDTVQAAEITARLERVYYDNLGLRLHLTGLRAIGPRHARGAEQAMARAVAAGVSFGRRQHCYQLMGDCSTEDLHIFESQGFHRVGVCLRRSFSAVAEPHKQNIAAAEAALRGCPVEHECMMRELKIEVCTPASAGRLAPLAGAPEARLSELGHILRQQLGCGQYCIMLSSTATSKTLAMAKVFIEENALPIGRSQGLLTGVAVAPAHRRQGLGTLVSSAATHLARQLGAQSIALDCFAGDSSSQEAFHERFYTKMGYRREIGSGAQILPCRLSPKKGGDRCSCRQKRAQ